MKWEELKVCRGKRTETSYGHSTGRLDSHNLPQIEIKMTAKKSTRPKQSSGSGSAVCSEEVCRVSATESE